MPGSTTTHCSPAAGATTQQLVSVTADRKPVISTADELQGRRVDGRPSLPRTGRRPGPGAGRRCSTDRAQLVSVDCRRFARTPADLRRTALVSTNQQRRDAERRRLQKQLEERRAREAARKRFTLIASIVGTLVVIAAVIIVVIATTGGADKPTNSGGGNPSPPSTSPAASSSSASQQPLPPAPTAPCAGVPKSASASFQGVTVTQATNIKHEPKVTSKSTAAPANLICQDLIVGKGKAATTASTVTVQYTGVLYKDGKQFDSSWTRGQPAQFPLNQVVPGFTEGIGGAGKVAPMKVGGRRIMILPASLAYGSAAQNGIPAHSTLVFVVDLKSIDS